MPGATENTLKVVRDFSLNLLLLKSTIPSKPEAFLQGRQRNFKEDFSLARFLILEISWSLRTREEEASESKHRAENRCSDKSMPHMHIGAFFVLFCCLMLIWFQEFLFKKKNQNLQRFHKAKLSFSGNANTCPGVQKCSSGWEKEQTPLRLQGSASRYCTQSQRHSKTLKLGNQQGGNRSLLQTNPEELDCCKVMLSSCYIQFSGVTFLLPMAWAALSPHWDTQMCWKEQHGLEQPQLPKKEADMRFFSLS